MSTDTSLPDSALRQWLGTGRLPLPSGRDKRGPEKLAVAFEHDLLRLGFVLDAQAREALFLLDDQQIGDLHGQVVSALKSLIGQAEHRHLFLRFPDIVVDDLGYLMWRLWTWMESEDAELGFRDAGTLLLEPCLHFVNQAALAGHGACPVCQVPIDRVAGEVFAPPEHQATEPERPLRTLRFISLDTALVITTLHSALSRRTPLAEHELLALRELVISTIPEVLGEGLTGYLRGTDRVVIREALAQVTGSLLGRDDARSLGVALLGAQLTSATDVLRAVDVMGGGDGRLNDARGIGRSREEASLNAQRSTFGSGSVLDRARQFLGLTRDDHQRASPPLQTKGEARKAVSLPKLSRSLRRTLLDLLEQRPAELLPEELGRHRRAWILLAERLHPLEDLRRVSVVAAFTVLRGGLELHGPSRFIRLRLPEEAGYQELAGLLRHRNLQSNVEWAFRRGDLEAAWTLLATRPGQLGRSLDRLVRASDAETLVRVFPVLERAFAQMTLPMLLSLRGHLRARAQEDRLTRSVRVRSGRVKVLPALPPLDAALVTRLAERITQAVVALPLADASPLKNVDLMQIDPGCAELMAPLAQRTASETLELIPAGSRMPIELSGLLGTPRLFVHWVEPEHSRVDLDLSAAFYSAEWALLSVCTFHSLTPVLDRRVVARHSGDLQAGPAPHGATEFVDLDLDALRSAQVRHVAITVHSFTHLPFEELTTCTSGVLIVPPGESQSHDAEAQGSPFRPDQVLQAARLQGREQTRLTFSLDLQDGVMTYADLPLGSHRTLLAGQDEIAGVLTGLDEDRRLGVRSTMQELAVIQAVRATQRVRVIHDQYAYTVRRQNSADFLADVQRLLSGDLTGAERSGLDGLEPADVAICRLPCELGIGANSLVVTPSPQRQPRGQPVSLHWLLDA
ncbi:hypothetical protein ACVWZX_003563 [Deinococcus sp. UYEF24]